MQNVGVTGFSVYVPRRRLSRAAAAAAQKWLSPGLDRTGARSVANWDEDTVTMAVEAARRCAPPETRASLDAVTFASTTPVFLDRLNAGIVSSALGLRDETVAADATGSRRAGLTSVLQALDTAAARGKDTLVVASERRRARASSALELAIGDAAAAVRVGAKDPIAMIIAQHTLTIDMIDRHRAADAMYEYSWEDRWIREHGFGVYAPHSIKAILDASGSSADAIDILVIPCPFKGLAQKIAADTGLHRARIYSDVAEQCGDLGAANALTLLAIALETAMPGQRILVIDFGQGCEAALLQVTDQISRYRPVEPFGAQIASGFLDDNYVRFLTMRGLIDWETRPKSEKDTRGSLSAMHRNRKMLAAFVAGRHRQTGEIQFPPSRMALGEPGIETDALEPYPLADRIGHVLSWSADRMGLTPDPPNFYGMIAFPEGGRLMMDFTDVFDRDVTTGMPMRMTFRIKDVEAARDFTRYFWKAQPVLQGAISHA